MDDFKRIFAPGWVVFEKDAKIGFTYLLKEAQVLERKKERERERERDGREHIFLTLFFYFIHRVAWRSPIRYFT